jgi:hypothetical protein
MTVMVQSGGGVAPLITPRLPDTQIERGLPGKRQGNTGKVVLNWEH